MNSLTAASLAALILLVAIVAWYRRRSGSQLDPMSDRWLSHKDRYRNRGW